MLKILLEMIFTLASTMFVFRQQGENSTFKKFWKPSDKLGPNNLSRFSFIQCTMWDFSSNFPVSKNLSNEVGMKMKILYSNFGENTNF